ncbi:MAG: tRNA (adenosine(37)-N6)-dimethylallyltransferase, partial [Planctomycetota bacterium]
MSEAARVPCLLGTTASGKTDVAIALARRSGGEIVSADAFAVYRGMEILSAAPVPPPDVSHHLVGILSPTVPWSAGAFVQAADRAVDEVRARGRVPWIVGGTALYLRAWLKGFGAPVPRDVALRTRLSARLDREGPGALRTRHRRRRARG